MIEFLRHITGLCGEHWHPNIWTALTASPAIGYTVYYIRCKYCNIKENGKRQKKYRDNMKMLAVSYLGIILCILYILVTK